MGSADHALLPMPIARCGASTAGGRVGSAAVMTGSCDESGRRDRSVLDMGGERLLRVNGVELCVETFGSPDDAAVLLIGGMSSSMDWWEDGFCERLAAGRRYVVRYDVIALLDALGIARAHLVGVSMGGAIGQCIAVEHPERVATLALIETTAALSGASA